MIVQCPMCDGQGLVFKTDKTPTVCPHCKGKQVVEVPDNDFFDLESGTDDGKIGSTVGQ